MENREIEEIKEWYLNKLKGKFYGLLREREKQGEWEAFLGTIEIELIGLEQQLASIDYYELRAKVSSLRYLKFSCFRKTIFECMELISSFSKTEDE